MSYPVENALYQWEEGTRRLQALADQPRVLRRANEAIEAIRDDIRRKVGATFTVAALSDLYGAGTDWAEEIAGRYEPARSSGWNSQSIADAAFHSHLRGAKDWAGGKLIAADQ